MIRLEKSTDISHTWIEIYDNGSKKMYRGEKVIKSTGSKQILGGVIASLRRFLYEKRLKGFCEIGEIDGKPN